MDDAENVNTGKFIRMVLGPVHFETRFLPFVQHNKETLKNYFYLVDNAKLYAKYADDIEFSDVEELRKTHPWSAEREVIYNGVDTTDHILNFREQCCDEKKLQPLPNNVLRFAFKHLAEKNITNVCYIGNNMFMVNNQAKIDQYFSSIPKGTFHVKMNGEENVPVFSMVQAHMADLLKEKFPNIIVPDDGYNLEVFHFGVNFNNKEEMLLFYEIWDFIVQQYNIDSRNNWFNIHGGGILGYTRIDEILGYMIRIFEVNFNYNLIGYLKYWSTFHLGVHVTTPHDTFYYANQLPGWGLYVPEKSDNIYTVKDYVKKYKKELEWYYTNHCGQPCMFDITEDGNVTLTFNDY